MSQRIVPIALIALLVILHGQLWFGRGSVTSVSKMTSDLENLRLKNTKSQLVNERVAEEVRDLKEGLEMVEEKARLELGMVKSNEIYVQFAKSNVR